MEDRSEISCGCPWDQAIKTIFLCRYLHTEALRRETLFPIVSLMRPLIVRVIKIEAEFKDSYYPSELDRNSVYGLSLVIKALVGIGRGESGHPKHMRTKALPKRP